MNYELLEQLKGKTIGAVLRENAQLYPERCYVIDTNGNRWSFAEFNHQVDLLAAGLLRMGMRPGDHLALWLPNGLNWLLTFFAAARIGVAVIPINTRYKAEEALYAIAQSESTALVVGAPVWGIDFYGMLTDLSPELATQSNDALSLKRFPALKHIIMADNSVPDSCHSFAEVAAETEDLEALREVEAQLTADSLLMISYTSGTTGKPKGVMHNHGVMVQATRVGLALHMEVSDTVLGHMPFYHVAGLFMAVLPAMTLGGALAVMLDWEAKSALKLIHAEKVNILGGIPTHYIDLLTTIEKEGGQLDQLKSTWIGGSTVPRETIHKIRDTLGIAKLMTTYGMTENTISTTFNRWDDSFDIICENKAPILADCEVIIVNPDTGEKLPAGKDGEIWCRGSTVMKGYYKKPEATKETITEDGWLRTGDIGRFDAQGYLSITGRRSDMFKTGGTNAYPAEIEQHLAKHPDVLMSAVVGAPDYRLGEVGYAFIQLEAGSKLTKEDITAHCKGKISDYKVPRYIEFVDDLPKTPSGKIKKFELSQAAKERLAGATENHES